MLFVVFESCRSLLVLICISTTRKYSPNGKYSPFVWKYIHTNGEYSPLVKEFYPFVGIDSPGGITSKLLFCKSLFFVTKLSTNSIEVRFLPRAFILGSFERSWAVVSPLCITPFRQYRTFNHVGTYIICFNLK